MPLNYSLQTGEQVEIITGKHSGPSRDWLNSNLGYVTTSRARAKIVHWFAAGAGPERRCRQGPDRTRTVAPGAAAGGFRPAGGEGQRAYRRGYVRRSGAGDLRLAHLVKLCPATGRAGPRQRATRTDPAQAEQDRPRQARRRADPGRRQPPDADGRLRQPPPGDPIVGYITLGRGSPSTARIAPPRCNWRDANRSG